MKKLYIVRSPLQLFNCIEARNRFSKQNENILIAAYRSSVDKKLLRQLINKNEWSQVIFHSIKRSTEQFLLIMKLFIRHSRIDTLYIGDYTSLINFYINIIKPKEIVMVDDGIATLKRAALIKSGSLHTVKKHLKSRMNLPTVIARGILQTSPKYLYSARFFTIYNLEKIGFTNRTIINDYRAFKNNITDLSQDKICFFIGTSMEDILISRTLYEKYFQILAAYFNKKKWVYVLHRKECAKYVGIVAEKFGVPVIRFNNIIESEFFIRKVAPTSVSSFCSSALDTIKIIYNPDIEILQFDDSDLLPTKRGVLHDYYKHQIEQGIKVTHFNEYAKKQPPIN